MDFIIFFGFLVAIALILYIFYILGQHRDRSILLPGEVHRPPKPIISPKVLLMIIGLISCLVTFLIGINDRIIPASIVTTPQTPPSPTHNVFPIETFPAMTQISETEISVSTFTPISAYYYEANLEGFGNYEIQDLTPGAMNFEYPVYLLPHSSETVTLTITPNLDVQTDLPEIFQRIQIPSDIPLQMSEYHNHFSNILVAEQMRAILSSEGIGIFPQFSNTLKDINPVGTTLWSWIIETPTDVGTHPLYLALYLGDNQEPIWSFSFTVSVTFPTETPLPTASYTLTPSSTPTLTVTPTYTPTKTDPQQLKEVFISQAPQTFASLMDFGSAMLGVILMFIGGLVGAYVQYKISQKSKGANADLDSNGKNTKDKNKQTPSE
jgi:hypothetical protein